MKRCRRMNAAFQRIFQPLLVSLLSLCAGGGVWAQLVELADKEGFSADAIALTFQEIINTAPAGDAYTAYGVNFVSESGGPLTLSSVPLQLSLIPPTARVLRNEPPPGMEADDALIVQFQQPIGRLGLQLDSIPGAPGTMATVQAFTVKGELLGTIEHPVPARPEGLPVQRFTGTFLGLETAHPLGISTVVINYGEEQPIEQVNEILIDPLTPRIFRTYLPHIIQGSFGELSFETIVDLVGSRMPEQEVTVKFFDSEGEPTAFNTNGQESEEIGLILSGFFVGPGIDRFQLGATSAGIRTGYGVVESRHPIQAQATYRISGPAGSQRTATASAAEGRVSHRVPVRKEIAQGLETAIAVINVGDAESIVTMQPLSDEGMPSEITNLPFFRLAPGAFRAFFFSELCDQVPPEASATRCNPKDFLKTRDFQGSVTMRSSQPSVVLAFETKNGLPVSLVPVGGSAQR